MSTINFNKEEGKVRGKMNGGANRRKSRPGNSLFYSNSAFKGKVLEMNGNVFQLPTERHKKDQYKETLEALRVYCASHFQRDVNYLDTMFKELKTATVPVPIKPQPVEQTLDDGSTIVIPADDTLLDVYRKTVEKYPDRTERLEASVRSVYTIIWGQCSELMRNKIREATDFEQMELSGNAAS